MVTPHDRSRIVCIDDSIGDLLEDRISQRRRIFHELTSPFRIYQFAGATIRPVRDVTDRYAQELCLVPHFFCAMPLCGLRLPMWPLSVPAVGSIAQLIRAGLPEASASVRAFASPCGSTAR